MITIPTLSSLYTAILSDIENEYGSSVPLFGKVFLRAVAAVQAGKMKIYYLILGKIQKNIFVDTADPEATGGTLERFGRVKLGRDPRAAVAGEYTVQVTGTIGAIIEGETTFRYIPTQKLFIIDEDFELTSSPDTIVIRALESGEASRLGVGYTLLATRPIAGVNQSATVVSEDIIPQSAEDIEDYRDAVIQAFQLEPQGGAASDYRLWAADVSGVAQVYPYAVEGQPANVIVYVEATIADSIDSKGTPSSLMLLEVAAVFEQDPDTTLAIDERGRRPLGVFNLDVVAVEVLDVVITIPSFVGLTSTTEELITAAIPDSVNQIRPFISSADVLELQDDVLDINRIINVILSVRPGSSFGTPTMTVDGTPQTTYTFEDGYIPFVTEVNFT